MKRFVALAVLVACGGTQKEQPPPKASPKECEQVADHLVGLMLKGIERNDATNQTADRIRGVIGRRCLDDKWSPEAFDCFTKLDNVGGKAPCETFLSIDQRDAIDKAIAEIFEAPPPS